MVIANPLPPNRTHLTLSLTLGRRHRPTLSLALAGAAVLVWCRAGGPACTALSLNLAWRRPALPLNRRRHGARHSSLLLGTPA